VTIEAIKPALYVACASCHKDCLADDLRDLLCAPCRVHRACADVREEIVAFFVKQQRYASRNVIANAEQLERLKRRLYARALTVVSNPQRAFELAEAEHQAALKQTPRRRFIVDLKEAAQLHPDIGRLQVRRA
jgi:hypothetical protein